MYVCCNAIFLLLQIPWSVKAKLVSQRCCCATDEQLIEWRNYLSQAKEVEVSLCEQVGQRLESEYVGLRKANPEAMDENEFSKILNLAKLIAKTELQSSFAWDHWTKSLQIYHQVSSS